MGKSVYLVAAVITTVVFLFVFLFVRMDESSKVNSLSEEIMSLYEEQQSNKILQSYLNSSDSNSCIVFERQISRQLSRVYGLFYKMEQLRNTTFATSQDSLKRQYLLASMSLWIDLKNASKTCKFEIKPVLYFFPDRENCVECDAMTGQLEVVKNHCSDIRVFAFPVESKDFEFVELLKNDYNVTGAPAVVIKEKVFYSVIPNEKLLSMLDCNK